MFEEVQREKYRDEIDYNTLKPPAAIWAAYKTNLLVKSKIVHEFGGIVLW
ncbi:hypothetical protein PtrSN002B_007451 [Pyrenophora tritici-repentis]|uniref:Uncharacterized protein n=1 Tax=Pyrenophora tritici-repentis (strain Pt-1C-BFP) TaxID=426418 RepID=B2WFZ4_PYRTR|nr:uncharacterized protein PTRG_08850 [Pyrenophora tritici-repentis Pt-1C-BFP]KAI1531975.1 hypothetical protein PtrSN001C_008125 [Pyrenophora tritici-repentis]EDU41901.1 predicted protein [Pyrenophora tritici-repentis Pt-1C-BFP]KAI1532295.1 hypothetical protein PtrSN001A_007346 [Pyrenophora tritici-repentis]KAI1544843.1 hypothetical protein PtrSN002B_007451 [Pyrenophora tritici-repentis]KAI1567263.1 hypothetical protein PtrEW4_007152 [Pyrenophora tritici-repentis]